MCEKAVPAQIRNLAWAVSPECEAGIRVHMLPFLHPSAGEQRPESGLLPTLDGIDVLPGSCPLAGSQPASSAEGNQGNLFNIFSPGSKKRQAAPPTQGTHGNPEPAQGG